MAAGYLSSEIRNCAPDLIGLRIPHRYVRGKNHGKTKGESWQWDMRVRADGKEALLEALQERVYAYEQERHDTLLTAWDRLGQTGAFMLDTSEPPERNLHVVFTDSRALAAVRFRSFMRDVRGIERPATELAQALEAERSSLNKFIAEQYESLCHSIDPSIVRLRPRRRVLVHKNAFDDLE